MNPKRYRSSNREYFFAEEGCYITELANSPEDPAVSVARARVKPGVTTSWHSLENTTERYVILSGEGLAYAGNQPACKMTSGDTLIIPPSCPQRIANTGKEDLVFLAVCTPRFRPENYRNLG